MPGISIGSNISYKGNQPNFTRDLFDTIEDMKNFPESNLPEIFLASCKETGKFYAFNKNNIIVEATGKWREFKSATVTRNVFIVDILPEDDVDSIKEDQLYILKYDQTIEENESVVLKYGKGIYLFDNSTKTFNKQSLDGSSTTNIERFDETGGTLYMKDSLCIYSKIVGSRKITGLYIALEQTMAPWNEASWEAIDATEVDYLTAANIEELLTQVSSEQWKYMEQFYQDDAISVTHGWTSSKINSELESIKESVKNVINIPEPPLIDGVYVLEATVSNGSIVYNWEEKK